MNIILICIWSLGSRIHSHIFPLIQDKLGNALSNWHPSDRSAKLMLNPWKPALPEGVFSAFLHKHVVPKLHICMQSLVINPHQQHLGKLKNVFIFSY